MTHQEALENYVKAILKSKKMSLVTINNGEVIETWDQALAKVIENCADINTTLTKRTITLKVEFTPSADRSYIPHKASVTYTLAGMAPAEGASNLRIDANGAGPYAERRNDPEQQSLFTNIEKLEDHKK